MRANVHTVRAKAKNAHNHVTAESAQPRNRASLVPRPHPLRGKGLVTFEGFLGCAESAGA